MLVTDEKVPKAMILMFTKIALIVLQLTNIQLLLPHQIERHYNHYANLFLHRYLKIGYLYGTQSLILVCQIYFPSIKSLIKTRILNHTSILI
jgi:hypothetical protein